ncbi:MAG: flagellin [Terriglobales bacterium]
MALTILNNIAAIAAENQLNITSGNLNSTLEQLSSGSRINSGADDPAGLAIANGLAANIAALTQSSSNATDGVGELQVADGALSQVTTLLDRAVTLATESATGTVSNSQRTALDAEYQSIKAEIDSIGSTTNYNGAQVFTNNTLNVFLSDGSTSGSSSIGITTSALSAAGLSLGGAIAATGTLTQGTAPAAVSATNTLTGANFTEATAAASTLTIAAGGTKITANDQLDIGGTTYTFVAALSGASNEVLIGGTDTQALLNLKAAVNGAQGGAGVAYGAGTVANANVVAGAATATTLALTANINGAGTGSGNAGTGNNAVTTVVAGGSGNESFTGATLAGAVTGATVSIGSQTYTFVAALAAKETANEVVASSEANGLTNLAAAVNGAGGTGYSANTTANTQVTAGTPTLTTLLFTASTAGTSGNFITTATTGVATGAWASVDFGGSGNVAGAAAGTAPVAVAGDTVTVGNQVYSFVGALGTPAANAIQVQLGSTETESLQNLTNAINGGSGLGVTYAYGTTATANTSAIAQAGASSVTFTAINKGTTGNSVALATTGSGANSFGAATFLTGGESGSIDDLLTNSDAQPALTLINGAVASVAALRGNIGSTVNRLQSASNVINDQTQNLTSAENDVTAADIPTAVAKLSQYSILEQTGISALAQANQQSQLVLKLLQ